MLAYAGAILVPIAVPEVWRKHSELSSNTFSLSTNSVMLCIPLTTMEGRLRSNRKSLCAQRPMSCGILGHSDTTSNVANRTSEGKSIMLRILQVKSSVSLIDEGIVGMYGWRKKSTISDIPSVTEPHAETTGLPGTPFICTFGSR